MTTPLLQYVARFDGGGEIVGFGWGGRLQGELTVVLHILSDSSICCAKRLATSFTDVLDGDKLVHHFPRFHPHIFLRAERCININSCS